MGREEEKKQGQEQKEEEEEGQDWLLKLPRALLLLQPITL